MATELPLNTANVLATALNNNLNTSSLNTFGQDHAYRVSGIEAMNTFPTKPNSDYAIFEANSDVFCWKTTDSANKASDRYFSFQEISREEAISRSSPYLMKGELESFKEDILAAISTEMANFKEEILNGKQPVRNIQYPYNRDTTGTAISSDSK